MSAILGRHPGGPRPVRVRRPLARGAAGLAAALLLVSSVAGCGFAAQAVVTPVPSAIPAPSLSPTLAAARAQVAAALAPQGFQLRDPQVAYRPGETPSFGSVPRLVAQAVIPAAPDRGFIVLYEFADAAAAVAGARDDAAYITSGIGRVQFPNDARFVIRQLGPVVVFYTWSPGSSPAPNDEQALATALGTLGEGFVVGP